MPALVGDDLDRRLEQVDVDAPRRGVLLLVGHRVVRQGLDDLTLLIRGAQGLLGPLVEVKVLLRHDDVHVGHLAQLAQLQRRELHLRRAAPTKDVNIRDRVLRQGLGDVGRDLRLEHVLSVLGEHARHVQRHVAHADDGHLPGLKRPRARIVRVSVVPGHEVRRAVGLRQIHARNVQRMIAIGTGRDHDRVVVVAQVVDAHVSAHLNVAEQPNVTALQDLVERDNDLLDARVIRRDAVAHQPIGGRKPLEEIDVDLEPRLRQDVGGVDAGGTSADDGDVERCQPSSPSVTARECAHLGTKSSAPTPRATLPETPHTPQGATGDATRPGRGRSTALILAPAS